MTTDQVPSVLFLEVVAAYIQAREKATDGQDNLEERMRCFYEMKDALKNERRAERLRKTREACAAGLGSAAGDDEEGPDGGDAFYALAQLNFPTVPFIQVGSYNRCGVTEALRRIIGRPLSMILPCPRCRELHIDAPEPDNGWTNPPHKSHLCHYCGLVWRPADVPTNGVAAIATRGEKDTWDGKSR